MFGITKIVPDQSPVRCDFSEHGLSSPRDWGRFLALGDAT